MKLFGEEVGYIEIFASYKKTVAKKASIHIDLLANYASEALRLAMGLFELIDSTVEVQGVDVVGRFAVADGDKTRWPERATKFAELLRTSNAGRHVFAIEKIYNRVPERADSPEDFEKFLEDFDIIGDGKTDTTEDLGKAIAKKYALKDDADVWKRIVNLKFPRHSFLSTEYVLANNFLYKVRTEKYRGYWYVRDKSAAKNFFEEFRENS